MDDLASLRDYVRYTVTLLAVLDPFLAVPIFIGVSAHRSEAHRHALALSLIHI